MYILNMTSFEKGVCLHIDLLGFRVRLLGAYEIVHHICHCKLELCRLRIKFIEESPPFTAPSTFMQLRLVCSWWLCHVMTRNKNCNTQGAGGKEVESKIACPKSNGTATQTRYKSNIKIQIETANN